MNNKIALESLVMDLKRVALGYQRGSIIMAKRFSEEALKRRNEISDDSVKPYVLKLLKTLDVTFREKDPQKIAEESLMISTLLQNYTQVYLK